MYRLCSRHYHLGHYNTNFTHFEAAAVGVAAAGVPAPPGLGRRDHWNTDPKLGWCLRLTATLELSRRTPVPTRSIYRIFLVHRENCRRRWGPLSWRLYWATSPNTLDWVPTTALDLARYRAWLHQQGIPARKPHNRCIRLGEWRACSRLRRSSRPDTPPHNRWTYTWCSFDWRCRSCA